MSAHELCCEKSVIDTINRCPDHGEIAKLQREKEELREALKPFAQTAEALIKAAENGGGSFNYPDLDFFIKAKEALANKEQS